MTHRIWNSIKGLSVVCAAGLGYQGQAQAQQAPAAPESNGRALEEVVVTAQRRAEAVNDIGMAIQAIDTSKLEQLAVANVQDLTAVVPSFTVAQAFTGVPTYTLRGVGFNTINISATSTVGTYVDEQAYAYPIMNTGPIFDLERVEVLKGPQGTLYGRNTTAGLINFISAKPTKDFQAGATADAGNYQTYNTSGFVSGPLIGDSLQGRLAFRVENSGKGWQQSVTSGTRQGEVEKYGARGALAFQPLDGTKVDFSINWFKNRSGTIAGQAVGLTPNTDPANPNNKLGIFSTLANLPNAVANSFPSDSRDADFDPQASRSMNIGTGLGLSGPLREDTKFEGFKLRLDQDIVEGVRLVSLTGYNHLERNTLSDFGGVPQEVLVQDEIGNINSFSEDLHFEGEISGVNYLVGGYYANDRILDSDITLLGANANTAAIRFVVQNGNPATGFPNLMNNPLNAIQGFQPADVAQAFRDFADVGNIKTESRSAFANADKQLTDEFKLTAGVRYTSETQRFSGCSLDINGNLLPTVNLFNALALPLSFGNNPATLAPATANGCVTYNPTTNAFGLVTSKLDENNIAGRLGLDYKPADGILLYTTVSQGAKAGGTPINAANISTQDRPVRQERLRAYEVGTKSSLFGRSVQANVSAFYYDYKNKQLNAFFADPIFTALAQLRNIPKSHVAGLDTDVTWRATDGLTLNATVLALQTRVDQYRGDDSQGNMNVNFEGSQFIYSPKYQGSLSAFYNMPVFSSYVFTVALNGRYQSRSRAILGELNQTQYDIPSYGVLNGSFGFGTEDGKWNATLWGRNLTDRYFFNSVTNNANTIVRFANPPRQFGATVSYNFK